MKEKGTFQQYVRKQKKVSSTERISNTATHLTGSWYNAAISAASAAAEPAEAATLALGPSTTKGAPISLRRVAAAAVVTVGTLMNKKGGESCQNFVLSSNVYQEFRFRIN